MCLHAQTNFASLTTLEGRRASAIRKQAVYGRKATDPVRIAVGVRERVGIVLWLIWPSVVTFHQLITLLVGSIIGRSNIQRRQIWYEISPTCKPCSSSAKARPLTFRNEAIKQHQHIIMRSCASWQLTSANIWWSRLAGFKLPCKRSKH